MRRRVFFPGVMIGVIVLFAALWGGVIEAGALPPVPTRTPAPYGSPIRYGDTLSGEITDSVPCVYFWFRGSADDSITLDMVRTSGTLDGVLSLYWRDGDQFTAEPLAFGDDRPGGLDPLITFRLPDTGWYTVEACRLQAPQMRVTLGTFDLTLSAAAGTAAPDTLTDAPTPTPQSGLTGGILPAEGAAVTPTPPGGLTGGMFGATATALPTALPAPGAPADGAAAGDEPATGASYTAIPCQNGVTPIIGRAEGEHLIDVYTAAGDSYNAADLVETTSFRSTDDLNVVFSLRPQAGPVVVGGIFCDPHGGWYDAGESDDLDRRGANLIGLDWEAFSETWPLGAWTVEIYVDDTLELTLGFTVE